MGVSDRLRIAFASDFGVLLLWLCVILSALGFAYLVLMRRKRQRDLLAYTYQKHFEAAEAQLAPFTYTSTHKADFFGRETLCQAADGRYGICRVGGPDLSQPEQLARFEAFYRAMSSQRLSVFAPYSHVSTETALITVQGRIIRKDGRTLMTAKQYLADAKMGGAEVEEVLIELARALGSLHSMKTDDGSALYHGFLIPRSLFLDFDGSGKLRNLLVADTGMAYAIGPRGLLERVEKLRNGKLIVERYSGQELLEQLSQLAPEQLDAQSLDEVGCAVDFYSYGALAVSLFTGRMFADPATIPWEMIPQHWRGFLKACLSKEISARPKDFLELIDWLQEPELGLTHRDVFGIEETASTEPQPFREVSLRDLAPVLEEAKKQEIDDLPEDAGLPELLERLDRSLSQSRWTYAEKICKKAAKLDATHPSVLIASAVLAYEKGDLARAEAHCEKAQEKDPNAAKKFRRYVAFRI